MIIAVMGAQAFCRVSPVPLLPQSLESSAAMNSVNKIQLARTAAKTAFNKEEQ
ncbi:hypothetical protein KIS4809_2660 [Bacillus sp. ZZV12-4809]|jgi:hypothetical protein|nr:hypothetical protein KIS4809_2660 [Bacillus sp. ZZV12-4809]